MKGAVWKVNDWEMSKYGDYLYKRVMFKNLETKKTFYLNLGQNRSGWQQWIPYLKEGNVLNVTMTPEGYVNQTAPFTIDKIAERNKV